jgi:hypothetical protein
MVMEEFVSGERGQFPSHGQLTGRGQPIDENQLQSNVSSAINLRLVYEAIESAVPKDMREEMSDPVKETGLRGCWLGSGRLGNR